MEENAHTDKIRHFARWSECLQHIHHVYDLHISVIFGLHFCLQTAKTVSTDITLMLDLTQLIQLA